MYGCHLEHERLDPWHGAHGNEAGMFEAKIEGEWLITPAGESQPPQCATGRLLSLVQQLET